METTNRGFDIAKFKDSYGVECSLQKSSSATQDKIWLGVAENRMHLTRKQVEELLPYLTNFVSKGELEGGDPYERKLYSEQDMDNAFDKGVEYGRIKEKE